jgi:hypothetical protein
MPGDWVGWNVGKAGTLAGSTHPSPPHIMHGRHIVRVSTSLLRDRPRRGDGQRCADVLHHHAPSPRGRRRPTPRLTCHLPCSCNCNFPAMAKPSSSWAGSPSICCLPACLYILLADLSLVDGARTSIDKGTRQRKIPTNRATACQEHEAAAAQSGRWINNNNRRRTWRRRRRTRRCRPSRGASPPSPTGQSRALTLVSAPSIITSVG